MNITPKDVCNIRKCLLGEWKLWTWHEKHFSVSDLMPVTLQIVQAIVYSIVWMY